MTDQPQPGVSGKDETRSEILIFDIVERVAWIRLNRPEAGNALNLALARALLEASIRCDTDREIRAVVLSGTGRLFCAGGDVGEFAAAGERVPALLSELAGTLHMAISRLARMAKPLLVLVNGPAAGAGFSLAMLGDIVLGARSAHFTPAYGAIGLTPDGGMSWLLPRLVGLRHAQEILLTNRRVKADEAAEIGIITRVVEDASLWEEGARVTATMAAAAVNATGATRVLLQSALQSDLEAQLEREVRSIVWAGGGAEAQEGLRAYFSKRPANFVATEVPDRDAL